MDSLERVIAGSTLDGLVMPLADDAHAHRLSVPLGIGGHFPRVLGLADAPGPDGLQPASDGISWRISWVGPHG
jgi:hypothetical protein